MPEKPNALTYQVTTTSETSTLADAQKLRLAEETDHPDRTVQVTLWRGDTLLGLIARPEPENAPQRILKHAKVAPGVSPLRTPYWTGQAELLAPYSWDDIRATYAHTTVGDGVARAAEYLKRMCPVTQPYVDALLSPAAPAREKYIAAEWLIEQGFTPHGTDAVRPELWTVIRRAVHQPLLAKTRAASAESSPADKPDTEND